VLTLALGIGATPRDRFGRLGTLDRTRRRMLVGRMLAAHRNIQCAHAHGEMVQDRFEDTMPSFDEPIVVGFIDVGLASWTRTCLRYLYPRLVTRDVLFSHDGDLPRCIEVFLDVAMWKEIGGPRPVIDGLGAEKLIAITKPPH
jgi:hypothetical protein